MVGMLFILFVVVADSHMEYIKYVSGHGKLGQDLLPSGEKKDNKA